MVEEYKYYGAFLPKKFFVTKGKALSADSPLNAFDLALMDAGIDRYNLVPVSSILPPDAIEVDSMDLTPGSVVFAVLAKMHGGCGETISAGVGWAWGRLTDGSCYGIVAEASGYKVKLAVEEELRFKLRQMAKARGVELGEVKVCVEGMENIPRGMYGCVIAALAYLPADAE